MHLKACGIVPQRMPAGMPLRNSVSLHCNRTLVDSLRSMMSLSDLPISFWGYELETSTFILNRAPSKSVETTPIRVMAWQEAYVVVS
jgi:hypothetical protein